MLGWAATFGLLALASGFAVFAGYARYRPELAFTLCVFAAITSLVLAIMGTRRAMRGKRSEKQSSRPGMN